MEFSKLWEERLKIWVKENWLLSVGIVVGGISLIILVSWLLANLLAYMVMPNAESKGKHNKKEVEVKAKEETKDENKEKKQ